MHYRLLQPAFINDAWLGAGSIVTLPDNAKPTEFMVALDTASAPVVPTPPPTPPVAPATPHKQVTVTYEPGDGVVEIDVGGVDIKVGAPSLKGQP